MNSVILQAEALSLPNVFAVKFQGKKVEIIDHDDYLTITPIESSSIHGRGILKGGRLGTEAFLEQKRLDKELEYEIELRS
jgi:virulence-associated protein VagC